MTPFEVIGGKGYSEIALVMSAPAVGAGEPMPVTVVINGRVTHLTVPVGWAVYSFPIFTSDTEFDITIESPTRDLGILQPDSPDKRKLGVGLDKIFLASTP
jgi:hypothetical protein